MARPTVTTLILTMMILAVMPLSISAEDSAGVQASSSTVSISPSDPVEGSSITIRLTMYNDNNFAVDDVLYKFYWDGVAPNKLITADTVDIPAKSTIDVEVVKSGLTVGEHKVWVTFDSTGDDEQMFFTELMVSGLADLEVTSISTSPETVYSGDSVLVSTLVSNTGSEDAVASRLQLDLDSQTEILNVPSILAGEDVWVNHTLIAPSAGDYNVEVTVDLDDAVIEADEDNQASELLSVNARMDLSHVGELSIDIESGSIEGPWVISGVLKRVGGNGVTQVPMKLEILDQNSQSLPLPIFYLNLTGGESVQQAWTYDLIYDYVSVLAPGNHQVTAIIDPFTSANFTQESTANDRISGYFDKYDVPDVSVDPYASPSKPSVTSGNNVDWTVTIANSGQIEVKGYLIYTWEGQTSGESSDSIITIQAAQTHIWQRTLPTDSGAHTAEFDAQWVPLSSSYDANPLNSYANGSIEVTAQLKLTWSKTSMSLVDSTGEPASAPLMAGDEYTVSIKVASQETGTVNYSCENELGINFGVITIDVTEGGQIFTIECTFYSRCSIYKHRPKAK